MKVIGITGGVGSGKSAVLDFLEKEYESIVVQADLVAHELMKEGTSCYDHIVAYFGESILREDRSIDRGKLGAIVFSDQVKREMLNSFVHPAVKQRIREEIKEAQEGKKCKFFIIEAALLLEDHYDEICDEIWYIYARKEVRMERLKQSRGYTEEKIQHMMASQLPEESFKSRCQRTIDNSGSIEATKEQIKKIIAHLYE